MLGKDRPNVWAYDRYTTNALSYLIYDNYSHRSRKLYFVYISHFLVSPRYYSTFGGSMRFSFSGNLNDYYHEFHGIENSFHDHNLDHVLIHVHRFKTMPHSLQRMVWIQLNRTSDFSSKARYFVQQQEDMISIQIIL